MGMIVAFPLARRLDFVERHARIISNMSAEVGEGHLQRQLDIQHQTLARKGVSDVAIRAELRSLQNAIRAALWRVVFAPRGRV